MQKDSVDLPVRSWTGAKYELMYDVGAWSLIDFDPGKIYQFAELIFHFCGMSYRVTEPPSFSFVRGFCKQTWKETRVQMIGLQGPIVILTYEEKDGDVSSEQKHESIRYLKLGYHVGFTCRDSLSHANSVFHIQAPFEKKRWTNPIEGKKFYCDGVETSLAVATSDPQFPRPFTLCIVGGFYREHMLYEECDHE